MQYLGYSSSDGGGSSDNDGGSPCSIGSSGLSSGYEHYTSYSRSLGNVNGTARSLFSN
jgi:hypothetical protein